MPLVPTLAALSMVMIDGAVAVDQDGWNRPTRTPAGALSHLLILGELPMSLCWLRDTDESKASLKARLLLALVEFLFEDVPRCAGLLSIWASAGAVWFLWLNYLCCLRHLC